MIEFYSVASAIQAADEAAKAAQITLIEVRIGYAIGGKGFVTLTGDVGAVRAAVEAASEKGSCTWEAQSFPDLLRKFSSHFCKGNMSACRGCLTCYVQWE